MATYNDMVKGALEDLGFLGAEEPLDAADAQKAFDILNDMLAEWSVSTLPGVEPAVRLSDKITAPRCSHSAIKANLAGRCAAPFRKPISPELAAVIRVTSKGLLKITAKLGPVKLPGTLPTGSGNQCDHDDSRFFPEQNVKNF